MERTALTLALVALCATASTSHAALDRMDTYRELYRDDTPVQTDAPQRRAMARYLGQAETAQEVRLREQAIHEVLALRPDLAPRVLDAATDFVADTLSVDDLRTKLHGMIQLFQLRPDLEADFLEAGQAFVDEASSVEGRRWKCRFLVAAVQLSPDLSAVKLAGLARFIDEASTLEGRKAKMDFVLRSLERPAPL